ncbi:expressed unknown protein [Seminavis robusta]|uniref:CRAL-TRIO domain-containing protein n=1 Tax=Seminavis robusta TaxID=568900 RepID=A0A9N8DS24_9STRA|nr:expressed unknown protein [Seminavis robusta]|eukprot:Sro239_g095990.1 n/a (346) ;mRNA; r:70820-71993
MDSLPGSSSRQEPNQVQADDNEAARRNEEEAVAENQGAPVQPAPEGGNNDDDEASIDSLDDYDDEDDDEDEEAPIPAVIQSHSPDGPERMALTEQERTWALAIKQACLDDPDLDPRNDFFYAQLALVDHGNVASAVERAQQMQYFRQEYGLVEENAEMAARTCREFVKMLPKFWLNFSYNSRDGNYVLAVDCTHFYVRKIKESQGTINTWMRATYLMCQAECPDLKAIRQGVIILAETDGFDWKTNFGLEVFKKFWVELCAVYPYKHSQIKNFHTGVLYNLLLSMTRRFVPKEIHERFQMGCLCELGRLDALYLNPTVEAANEKLLAFTDHTLRRRYANEAAFTL